MTTAVANRIAANGAMTPVSAGTDLVVHDSGPLSYLFDSAKFNQLQRVATIMGAADFTPKHLIGKSSNATIGNCFRVAAQALRWGVDPFAVMDETYVVQGKLGYQGKLVTAVINAHAGLQGRLTFKHSGSGLDRTVEVIGTFAGEGEARTVTLSVKQAKTANKMWTEDPDQKLCYSGAIRWARRHCPEIILGVITDDDLDRMSRTIAVQATKPQTLEELHAALDSPRGAMDEAAIPTREEIGEALEGEPQDEVLVEPTADEMDALTTPDDAAPDVTSLDEIKAEFAKLKAWPTIKGRADAYIDSGLYGDLDCEAIKQLAKDRITAVGANATGLF